MSTEFYSNIVSYPFTFTDDEILENYTSLLKGLATNILPHELETFILKNNFSLYARAIMFINYPDSLIRTAARTVVLTILKRKKYVVNNTLISAYVMDSGFVFYMVNILKEQLYLIDKAIKASEKYSKLESLLNDCIDTMYYINDILQVDAEFYCKVSNSFLAILMPVLIGSIKFEVHESYHVSIHLSCYIIAQVLCIVKSSYIVDSIASCLISDYITQILLDACLGPPPNSPPSLKDFESGLKEMNPIKPCIVSFLKCKDDNLVCLSLLALQFIISNKTISKKLLKELGLPTHCSEDVHIPCQEPCPLNSDILDVLMSIYSTYPLFRFTTYHIVSKIFLALLHCCNSQLTETYQVSIRQLGCSSILKLQKLLESTDFREILLDLFDEEWEFIAKIDLNKNVHMQTYNILPFIDDSLNVPLIHRKPNTDNELCRSLIKLFLMVRKLVLILNSEDPGVYPFVYSSKIKSWEVGNVYCTAGMDCLRVLLHIDNGVLRYIVDDEIFFVLVEPDHYRLEYASVVSIIKWRNLKLTKDDKTLSVKLFPKNSQKPEFLFSFDDPTQYLIELQKMRTKIVCSKDLEISIAESFLMDVYTNFFDKI